MKAGVYRCFPAQLRHYHGIRGLVRLAVTGIFRFATRFNHL